MKLSEYEFSLISLILTVIALATFFQHPMKYTLYDRLVLWMYPDFFFFVTSPLIVSSIVLAVIAWRQNVKNKKSVALPALVFALYLLFVIYISTFAIVQFDIASPLIQFPV